MRMMTMHNFVAKKQTKRFLNAKINTWALYRDDVVVGEMMVNDLTEKTYVTIFCPYIGRYVEQNIFSGVVVAEALAWARNTVENISAPSIEDAATYRDILVDERYHIEMSDDYCYSNGRYDRIMREINRVDAYNKQIVKD